MINSPLCRGAVAQLGERLHGMQEVVSSNLISSIAQSRLFPMLPIPMDIRPKNPRLEEVWVIEAPQKYLDINTAGLL